MVTVLRTELYKGGHTRHKQWSRDHSLLCLANLPTRPTVGYKVRCLVPPLSRVLLATCVFHILLQIDVDAGCQNCAPKVSGVHRAKQQHAA